MTASGTNCYLVGSGVRRTLVDTGSPGAGQSCNEALEAYQQENGKVELERIICTHWHPDHTGGISDILSQRQKCPTLKHRNVIDLFETDFSFENQVIVNLKIILCKL